jgi:hypothetical protein
MKVLIDIACQRVGEGIASSLFWVSDIEVIMWLSNTKPTMDMFDETKPDILIAESAKFATPEMKIATSRYPHTKVISIGDPVEFKTEPHLSISEQGIAGIPSVPFEGGAMVGNIGSPSRQDHLQTDLLCITDYIVDHERADDALNFLCENYNIKIFGRQKVSFPHYLGQVDVATQSQALASTAVYIDLDGDSWYDAAWLGKECVSVSKSCFRNFNNVEELQVAVNEALETGEGSSEEIKMLMKNKTYFELTNEILSFFGLVEQRNQIINKKRDLIC